METDEDNTTTKGRAEEINSLHYDICVACRKTLEQAIRLGELLTEQKEELNHGDWEPWLEVHIEFSKETARNYMRVYRFRDELIAVNVTDLTTAYKKIREILKRADDEQPDQSEGEGEEVEISLTLSKHEAAEYADRLSYLSNHVYHTADVKGTILAAIDDAYERATTQTHLLPLA